ncbi:DUF2442 domain-containing protein [uncultured Duncaniella sp.]|uniref:DUF2442 domain-containing protein n=1 Tax=uncultured Duncaniella sp. TaxID=2768039 RepID=UPI0025D0C097|nr:DUF2442 domain-containing protein [uncultured Duncaniella sp.]
MNRTDISRVWLTPAEIWIETTDGRKACERFSDYSRFQSSSLKQRENYTLSHFGIHWPEIDEDLSFDGFFKE